MHEYSVAVPRSLGRYWLFRSRTRIAKRRHRELGEISAEYFLATRLRRGCLVFDVGANHATFARAAYSLGARVVAVEPQAELAAEIRTALPGAAVVASALGAAPGTATLIRVKEMDQMATTDRAWLQNCPVPVTAASEEEVPVTTLDALIGEHGVPEFIKIDAEGSDHRILQGLSVGVNQILFEVNSTTPSATVTAFERIADLGRYEFLAAPIESWLFRPVEGPQDVIHWMRQENSYDARALDIYARLLRR